MNATAVAHPIPGLIKYHGLADPVLRLPFHDSISVCTAPLTTRTTVEFGESPRDQATIDGREVTGRDMERIRSVVDPIRAKASSRHRFRMASENDFPSNIGLGASASGFAALAMASANAAGLDLGLEEVSRFARRGAGSAARAVTGGFSKWKMGLWQPDTLRVIRAVRRLREQGVPAFFSIDTGATVYVNTFPDRTEQVRRAIADLGIETIPCTVGGPARVVEEALF